MNEQKTIGQIQDLISKKITKYYLQNMGMGPKQTRVYIVEDMIITRLKINLLPFEKKLLEHTNGITTLKNIRKTIHETIIKGFCDIITSITKHKVISSHSDISTKSGEIVHIYVLDINYENQLLTIISRGRP